MRATYPPLLATWSIKFILAAFLLGFTTPGAAETQALLCRHHLLNGHLCVGLHQPFPPMSIHREFDRVFAS